MMTVELFRHLLEGIEGPEKPRWGSYLQYNLLVFWISHLQTWLHCTKKKQRSELLRAGYLINDFGNFTKCK